METVKHKFDSFENLADIEILILGTFNPSVEKNQAEFFYGRNRNYLWNLLPKSFNYRELKKEKLNEKIEFINKYKIGFADLISEINVEKEQENNYSDPFIDSRVAKWNDIITLIKKHKNIKYVYFTRKTLNDIPEMKKQLIKITEFCSKNNIQFIYLPTPARFENEEKLNEWKKAFKND